MVKKKKSFYLPLAKIFPQCLNKFPLLNQLPLGQTSSNFFDTRDYYKKFASNLLIQASPQAFPNTFNKFPMIKFPGLLIIDEHLTGKDHVDEVLRKYRRLSELLNK